MMRTPGRKQLTLEFGHLTSFAEADFVVTDANKLAFGHIKSFPKWSAPLTLITGPAKSGKSHLAGIWERNALALRPTSKEIDEVAGAGGQTPVVLDDVDRENVDEHALFHLLNQSIRDTRPILMTARTPISGWPFKTDDVKSRARLAAHFSVLAADDEQLAQMFAKIFGDRQVSVEPKIISYLVARMERSPEEVVILAALMDEIALTRGKPISRTIASEALEERTRLTQRQGQFWNES